MYTWHALTKQIKLMEKGHTHYTIVLLCFCFVLICSKTIIHKVFLLLLVFGLRYSNISHKCLTFLPLAWSCYETNKWLRDCIILIRTSLVVWFVSFYKLLFWSYCTSWLNRPLVLWSIMNHNILKCISRGTHIRKWRCYCYICIKSRSFQHVQWRFLLQKGSYMY